MNPDELYAIAMHEAEMYLRNLAVPLTITLVLSFFILKAVKDNESTKLRSKHRDQLIEELIALSYTFSEYLDQFHIRSKYDPQLVETLSEKMAYQISRFLGLASVYFAKTKNINKLKESLKEIRSLYNQLSGRREPLQPVSPTEYTNFQESFSIATSNLMKVIRQAKMY